jgi:Arc/MetJ-type ribon-helix-helix transcriptional regulator
MAETITQITQPPEFIEAAAKPYITELQQAVGGFKGADLSKVYGPQFIAGQDPLQAEAIKVATAQTGLGSFAPFLQTASTQAGEAAKQAGLAGQFVGPKAYEDFMSPYQQDVIKATLDEFDEQSRRGLLSLQDRAIAAGASGGSREGVERGIYQSQSDRNRSALLAQLNQAGFGQAQQAAAQAFSQQQALANQQQALSTQQQALAGLSPQLAGQQVAGLTSLGGGLQAQRQSELGAQQQLAQQQLQQPITAAQTLGSGITSLIAGYPGTNFQQTSPSASPLQSALGLGSTLAGIYRAFG